MNATIWKWHFLNLVCDKEQVFSTWCGTTSFSRSTKADSLATEKGRLLFCHYLLLQFAGAYDTGTVVTEMTGGENFEGKGMLCIANQLEPQ